MTMKPVKELSEAELTYELAWGDIGYRMFEEATNKQGDLFKTGTEHVDRYLELIIEDNKRD